MTNKNDGGLAFPHPGLGDPRFKPQPGDFGMTLRDYFAAQAMPSVVLMVESMTLDEGETFADTVARFSYEFADEMLAAREVPE